jgi:hypothetical protein
MKNLKSIALLFLFTLLSMTSCKNSSSSLTPPITPPVTTIVQSGTWKITNYNEKGIDHTSYFAGYSFTFNTNGTITGTNGSKSVSGTYATQIDDSTDKMVLNFSSINNFDELNEDWRIVEKTASKIRLEHISGGNGGTSLLTFEKN